MNRLLLKLLNINQEEMTILKKHFTFGTPQCIQSDFNPLRTNVPHHIETSQLTCNANQLTGFYMMENIGP